MIESFAKHRFKNETESSPNVKEGVPKIKIFFKEKRKIVLYSSTGLLEEVKFSKEGGNCEVLDSKEYLSNPK